MKKAHEDGAYDDFYARRRAEALARDEEADAKEAKERRRNRETSRLQDDRRKRKKEEGVGLARDETELKERVLVLRERLGHGPTEVVLVEDDYDEYGGLFETKGYKADVAALAKLEDENTDALAIKKKERHEQEKIEGVPEGRGGEGRGARRGARGAGRKVGGGGVLPRGIVKSDIVFSQYCLL